MSSIVNAIGWALLHFVWQGVLVAVLFRIGLRMLRTADARYALGVAAMLAMLALPIVTAVRHTTATGGLALDEPSAPAPAATAAAEIPVEPPASGGIPSRAAEGGLLGSANAGTMLDTLERAAAPAARFIPLLVGLWLAGVFLLSLRLFDAWLQARRLTRDGTAPAPEEHRRTLERLAARLGLTRRVSILESAVLQSPAVVGWLRPVILLPAVALTGLTPQQVDALIAHELAHVKRHDFLANLVQSAIETLLFYHPAVWYVSRRVRELREHCCDDVAVRISGSADAYARALLGLAEARAAAPALVPAATGGPLLARIRRLLVTEPAADAGFPRWIAGGAVVIAALALGSASRVLEANEAGLDSATILPLAGVESGRAGADTVLHAPAGPLATKWQWARDEARRRGFRAFWVGYTIEPLQVKGGGSIYVGRLERSTLQGSGISLRGRIVNFGDFEGFRTPGVRLAPLIGGGMPDDVAILFLYTTGGSGRPTLARVHASSLALPVDLEGRPVLWLGQGADAESVPLVRGLFDAAPSEELREDLVAMVGVHSSNPIVVPALLEWADGAGPVEIRTEAVEWLGRHADPRALAALARLARRDRSEDVRREAAEAVAEMDLQAATDTLIALARTLEDVDARREAVEGLGERDDDRSVAALADIARNDRNGDLQREAIETIGETESPRALAIVEELARSHPSLDARREAIETLGEISPDAATIEKLARIAREEGNADMADEAIETIAETGHAEAAAVIAELARTHRLAEVRRAATESLAELDRAGTATLLEEIAARDGDAEVRREAVETLGELQGPERFDILIRFTRDHGDYEVRREAVETLGEAAPADRFLAAARALLDADPPEPVWHEVLETLEELEGGAGIPLLISTARSHRNLEIRKHALETLADSDDPRARKLFEDALAR